MALRGKGKFSRQNIKSFLNPNAPTVGTATNAGSGRAYNNGSATITFTASATGAAATSFTATSSPGSYTVTGASSPLTITGLQSATAYTFVVKATNSVGDSSNSSASNSITATTVPQAPTIGSATAGNASSTVTYTAGATGGSAITTFTATSSGAQTGTGGSPITVSGSNGTAYTFTVRATNANGQSAASSASNSVTPVAPNPYPIGSTGPGGGKVFYDAGSVLSWGRWIEGATAASSPSWVEGAPGGSPFGYFSWAGYPSYHLATSTAIGTGKANTLEMQGYQLTNDAGKTCYQYTGGGLTYSWFLPSSGELDQMYTYKTTLGMTSPGYYWSSSQAPTTTKAYAKDFTGGGTDTISKSGYHYFRACRYIS